MEGAMGAMGAIGAMGATGAMGDTGGGTNNQQAAQPHLQREFDRGAGSAGRHKLPRDHHTLLRVWAAMHNRSLMGSVRAVMWALLSTMHSFSTCTITKRTRDCPPFSLQSLMLILPVLECS